MTSSSTSSSSAWRRASESSSCWSACRSLAVPGAGRPGGPGCGPRGRGPAARRPRPWRPRAGCRRARSRARTRSSSSALRLASSSASSACSGRFLRRVGDLVQTGVDRLQVEQSPLTGRVGFQDVPPGTSGRCGTDHEVPGVGAQCGDVGLQPQWPALGRSNRAAGRSAGARQPERLGGPVAGVDEVRRAAPGLLARLEDRVVAQVRGDVDVGAAGPDVRRTGRRRRRRTTATRRTTASSGSR